MNNPINKGRRVERKREEGRVRGGWEGTEKSWTGNFYLSEAACTGVSADPSLRYTSMLLGR